jgi:hypothetical protein
MTPSPPKHTTKSTYSDNLHHRQQSKLGSLHLAWCAARCKASVMAFMIGPAALELRARVGRCAPFSVSRCVRVSIRVLGPPLEVLLIHVRLHDLCMQRGRMEVATRASLALQCEGGTFATHHTQPVLFPEEVNGLQEGLEQLGPELHDHHHAAQSGGAAR